MTDETENPNDTAREILRKIDEAWSPPIVLRKDIEKFSCGLITVKTMATLDSRGNGARNIRINGKITYNKKALISWLASRIHKRESSEEKKGAPRRGKNDVLLKK